MKTAPFRIREGGRMIQAKSPFEVRMCDAGPLPHSTALTSVCFGWSGGGAGWCRTPEMRRGAFPAMDSYEAANFINLIASELATAPPIRFTA